MRLTPQNIIHHELIGLDTKVVDSTNRSLIGIEGRIVDETKNLLTIETDARKKKSRNPVHLYIHNSVG